MQMPEMVADFQSCLFVNMFNESAVLITIGCDLMQKTGRQSDDSVGQCLLNEQVTELLLRIRQQIAEV